MNKRKTFFWAMLLAFLMTGLGFLVGKDWGYGAAFASAAYAVLISVFLLAQIYGFVLGQVKYSETVEDTKFKVLEAEGIFLESEDEDAKAI